MKVENLDDAALAYKIFLIMDKDKWDEDEKKQILSFLQKDETIELQNLFLDKFKKNNSTDISLDAANCKKRLKEIHEKIKGRNIT